MIINSVLANLVYGGIIALIVLAVFLKSVRPTVIIAFSIPLSLLFEIVLMYFSGVTLNMISLAVGMLVDNSIVVIENIYRLRSMGGTIPKLALTFYCSFHNSACIYRWTFVCNITHIVPCSGLIRYFL